MCACRDTVDSVGMIPRHVPFTKHNTCVKTFRHAMALDEHRVKFKPNLFDKVVNVETYRCDLSYTPFGTRTRNIKEKLSHFLHPKKKCENPDEHDDKYNRGLKLQDQYTDPTRQTNVLEVWFAGCHTGGSLALAFWSFLVSLLCSSQMWAGAQYPTRLATAWRASPSGG